MESGAEMADVSEANPFHHDFSFYYPAKLQPPQPKPGCGETPAKYGVIRPQRIHIYGVMKKTRNKKHIYGVIRNKKTRDK